MGWAGKDLKDHRDIERLSWFGKDLEDHRDPELVGLDWKGSYRSQSHRTVGLGWIGLGWKGPYGSQSHRTVGLGWVGKGPMDHRAIEWLSWVGLGWVGLEGALWIIQFQPGQPRTADGERGQGAVPAQPPATTINQSGRRALSLL